jgi:hypothetical protein
MPAFPHQPPRSQYQCWFENAGRQLLATRKATIAAPIGLLFRCDEQCGTEFGRKQMY